MCRHGRKVVDNLTAVCVALSVDGGPTVTEAPLFRHPTKSRKGLVDVIVCSDEKGI